MRSICPLYVSCQWRPFPSIFSACVLIHCVAVTFEAVQSWFASSDCSLVWHFVTWGILIVIEIYLFTLSCLFTRSDCTCRAFTTYWYVARAADAHLVVSEAAYQLWGTASWLYIVCTMWFILSVLHRKVSCQVLVDLARDLSLGVWSALYVTPLDWWYSLLTYHSLSPIQC